jgi:hypothetical protein
MMHPPKTDERYGGFSCRCRVRLILLAFLLVWASPRAYGEETLMSYQVQIEGISSDDLLQEITKVSNCVALQDRPPASLDLLR